ncbi:hypothetical protein CRENBAI_023119, partial [Crenichthys baileyi]
DRGGRGSANALWRGCQCKSSCGSNRPGSTPQPLRIVVVKGLGNKENRAIRAHVRERERTTVSPLLHLPLQLSPA